MRASRIDKMKFLRLQCLILRLMGFTGNENENFAWITLAWFHSIALALITLPEIHFIIANVVDIPLATDALCPYLTCLLSLSKLFTMNMNKAKFYRMMSTLQQMWNSGISTYGRYLIFSNMLSEFTQTPFSFCGR